VQNAVPLGEELDYASKKDCEKYKDNAEQFKICVEGWNKGHDWTIAEFLKILRKD
jgi:hypothetical protein